MIFLRFDGHIRFLFVKIYSPNYTQMSKQCSNPSTHAIWHHWLQINIFVDHVKASCIYLSITSLLCSVDERVFWENISKRRHFVLLQMLHRCSKLCFRLDVSNSLPFCHKVKNHVATNLVKFLNCSPKDASYFCNECFLENLQTFSKKNRKTFFLNIF